MAAVLPPPVSRWVFSAALALVGTAFLVSYRSPQPFMARWMRDEIREGHLAPARPDRIDWALFWVALPVVVAGTLALLALIVFYPAAM